MVCEHNARGFEGAELANTFSTATFGNGLVSIAAGLVASVLTDVRRSSFKLHESLRNSSSLDPRRRLVHPLCCCVWPS